MVTKQNDAPVSHHRTKLIPKTLLLKAKIHAMLSRHPHGLTRNELQVEILTRDLTLHGDKVMSYRKFAEFIVQKSTPINMICPAVRQMLDDGKIRVAGIRPSTITGVDNEVLVLTNPPAHYAPIQQLRNAAKAASALA